MTSEATSPTFLRACGRAGHPAPASPAAGERGGPAESRSSRRDAASGATVAGERATGAWRSRVAALAPVVATLGLVAGCGSAGTTATAPTTAPAVTSTPTTSADAEDTDTTATPGAVSGAAALGAGRDRRRVDEDDDSSAVGADDGATSGDTTPDEGIVAETGADEVATDATWATSAIEFRGSDGLLVAYVCPADGTLAAVWGTDAYTDDSSVCTAAVHLGLINELDGGLVVIQISGGLDAYEGSTANGVTSGSYGAWSGTFTFVS